MRIYNVQVYLPHYYSFTQSSSGKLWRHQVEILIEMHDYLHLDCVDNNFSLICHA